MLEFELRGVLSSRLVHGREMKRLQPYLIGDIDKEGCSITLNIGQMQVGN